MSARPHQSLSRSAALAGAGVAGLAALFVAPAAAQAAPAPVTDRVEPQATNETSSADTTAPAITADYGYQKYRVGVRGKSGDYYPDGTSTAGTKLHVVETGSDGKVDREFDCTTEPNDPNVVTDATFCKGENQRFFPELPPLELRKARKAASVNEPSPGNFQNSYYPDAGATVKITQISVNPNLVTDSSTATLEPCRVGPNPYLGQCGTNYTEGSDNDEDQTSTDLIFVDPGIPPVATDDSATTKEGVAVDIAIAPNDTPNVAPLTSVKIVDDAKNGTAKLVTAESAESSAPPADGRQAAGNRSLAAVTSYRAIYTPKAGFIGVDTFKYTIATQNGTATATVRVTVTGAAASSDSASASPSADTNDENDLADTGTQSGDLVGYGAALLAAGAGALAIGQKRRRGRHAR